MIGPGLARNHIHHCRLAGAVRPDDATQLADVDVKVQRVQRLEAIEADGQVLEVENVAAVQMLDDRCRTAAGKMLNPGRRVVLSDGGGVAHLWRAHAGTSPTSPRGRNSVTRMNSAPSAYSQTSGSAPVRKVFA